MAAAITIVVDRRDDVLRAPDQAPRYWVPLRKGNAT
jgi:hypothetical protein